MKPFFIAEVKTRSPFGFRSKHSFKYLLNLACTFGDAVSVHTHNDFGGSFESLMAARSFTKKEVIAKGFHYDRRDITKAFELGANYVFQVGGIPLKDHRIWYEPTSTEEFNRAVELGVICIVINSKNPLTGKPQEWEVELNGSPGSPGQPFLIQASLIKTPKDIKHWASGFIVGQSLPEFIAKSCGKDWEKCTI